MVTDIPVSGVRLFFNKIAAFRHIDRIFEGSN